MEMLPLPPLPIVRLSRVYSTIFGTYGKLVFDQDRKLAPGRSKAQANMRLAAAATALASRGSCSTCTSSSSRRGRTDRK